MKQFLDSYRFVKLCKRLIDETEQKSPPEFRLVGFQGAHAVTASAKRDYMKKYPKTTLSKASYICVDAIKNGYLEGHVLEHKGMPLDTVCITTKGRKLLDLPFGTVQEFFTEYGLAVSFFTGGVFSAIVTAVIGLVAKISTYTDDLIRLIVGTVS